MHHEVQKIARGQSTLRDASDPVPMSRSGGLHVGDVGRDAYERRADVPFSAGSLKCWPVLSPATDHVQGFECPSVVASIRKVPSQGP